MNEQENTQLVKKTYELFTAGDIETLLGMYSDDISWETPKVANSPLGGKISGRERVIDFFTRLDENEEFSVFDAKEFIAEGDKVVVLGHFVSRIKSTDKEYATDFVHIVRVAGGKIAGFLEFFDTAAAERAHTAAAQAA